jgi:hypothetical protein
MSPVRALGRTPQVRKRTLPVQRAPTTRWIAYIAVSIAVIGQTAAGEDLKPGDIEPIAPVGAIRRIGLAASETHACIYAE